MLRFAWMVGAASVFVSAAGCGGSDTYSSCPPGQSYDPQTGQCFSQQMMCPPGTQPGPQGCMQVGMQQGGCPPGQVWNGTMCAPQQQQTNPGGMFGATACTPAQPADPNSAMFASQGLAPLGQQHAPGGRPVGNALVGNFQPGQCLEVQVTMNPGRCYTAVGLGAQGQEVDLQIVPAIPGGFPAPPAAADQSSGSMAVLGSGNTCFKWFAPVPGPMKFVLRVPSGQGMAAAQLYEK